MAAFQLLFGAFLIVLSVVTQSTAQLAYEQRALFPPTSGLDNMDDAFYYNGSTYFIRGDQYWHHDDLWLAASYGYPKALTTSTFLASIPADVDAVCQVPNSDYTYFFKGSQYWAIDDSGTVWINANSISADWPGIPDSPDACFFNKNDEVIYQFTYFFKGNQYWRWDHRTGNVTGSYPDSISGWGALFPADIDGIFVWEQPSYGGEVYIFKGSLYWSYSVLLQDTIGPWPLSDWEGCIPEATITGWDYEFYIDYVWLNIQFACRRVLDLNSNCTDLSTGEITDIISAFFVRNLPILRCENCNENLVAQIDSQAITLTVNTEAFAALETIIDVYTHEFSHLVDFEHPNFDDSTFWSTCGAIGSAASVYCGSNVIYPQTVDYLSPAFVIADAFFVDDGSLAGKTYFISTTGDVSVIDNSDNSELSSTTIDSLIPGLPTSIDAAFVWKDDKAYFFSGSSCYRASLDTFTIDSGFPQPISTAWPGIPNDLDAAFRLVERTFFFKGTQFWTWRDSATAPEPTSPESIVSSWTGIPDNIDGVTAISGGQARFFKGTGYYLYSAELDAVEGGHKIFQDSCLAAISFPEQVCSYQSGSNTLSGCRSPCVLNSYYYSLSQRASRCLLGTPGGGKRDQQARNADDCNCDPTQSQCQTNSIDGGTVTPTETRSFTDAGGSGCSRCTADVVDSSAFIAHPTASLILMLSFLVICFTFAMTSVVM